MSDESVVRCLGSSVVDVQFEFSIYHLSFLILKREATGSYLATHTHRLLIITYYSTMGADK